jgi:hypothetical protein
VIGPTDSAARRSWTGVGLGLEGWLGNGLERWWNLREPAAWVGERAVACECVMAVEPLAGEPGSEAFCILGPLEVSRSGWALPLGGPRQRAVLALLLVQANRIVSMDRLAEDVCGGEPPEGRLRRALEPDRTRADADGLLVTGGRGYLLRIDREQLDAARFEDGFTAGRAALEAGRSAEAAETLRVALDLWGEA